MLKPMMGNVIVVLISLSMTGCSIYDKYGHGRVVSSKLDEASVTPVDMPPNAPSISQRFLPQGVSSKSEHKGFDILVPSRTPVLVATDDVVSRVQTSILYGRQVMIDHGASAAGFPQLHFEVHRMGEGVDAVAVRFMDPQLFWVDGQGRNPCYDKQREWHAEPLVLCYPVPCLAMDWQ